MKLRWLDRRVAAPGPFLVLVRSQQEFDAAMRCCRIPVGAPYLKTQRADATTHILFNKRGESVCVVALGTHAKEHTGVEIAGLLVHEAVHIWQEHCLSIGETSPASEQTAYGIQGIAQTLMEEYARQEALP
jgi:hypothetical protein